MADTHPAPPLPPEACPGSLMPAVYFARSFVNQRIEPCAFCGREVPTVSRPTGSHKPVVPSLSWYETIYETCYAAHPRVPEQDINIRVCSAMALGRDEERERCARVAESMAGEVGKTIAQAIRAASEA